MSNEIEKKGFTKEQIELIKNTVAKGANNNELKLFLHLAQKYNLDPFTHQIFFIKDKKGENRIFTGRDGFLSIAHRDGNFDGMESGVRTIQEPLYINEIIYKNGKYAGVQKVKIRDYQYVGYAEVWRKDMKHSFKIEVWEEEYNVNNHMWKTKPRTMIQKVAESQALRRAFNISGLYAPEELGNVVIAEPSKEENYVRPFNPPHATITDAQRRLLFAKMGDKAKEFEPVLKAKFGIKHLNELLYDQMDEALKYVEELKQISQKEEALQNTAEPEVESSQETPEKEITTHEVIKLISKCRKLEIDINDLVANIDLNNPDVRKKLYEQLNQKIQEADQVPF